MAEVRTYAEQCPVGGGIIHLGATSMDIEDNADALRIRDALDFVLDTLRRLPARPSPTRSRPGPMRRPWRHPPPARRADHGGLPAGAVRARPAGRLRRAAPAATAIRGKGFKGAVGTSASYVQF